MLFLFKSYQATLDVPDRLASSILLLKNTSVPVDFFRDTRPISEKTDPHLSQLNAVLSFFNKWEETISQTNLYTTSKHLFHNRPEMILIHVSRDFVLCVKPY